MKTVYITRRETFNSAHRLFREDWSDEKNNEVFGKCSNKNWHGHNYVIFVTVKGVPSQETGFVINLKKVSAVVREFVLRPLDHKNMNIDVPFLKGIIPSTENVVMKIWDEIEEKIRIEGGELVKIKLHETENNYVEYFGGNTPF